MMTRIANIAFVRPNCSFTGLHSLLVLLEKWTMRLMVRKHTILDSKAKST